GPVYPSLRIGGGVARGIRAWSSDVGPANGTDNSQLSVSGGGKSGSSNTFKVAPAGLDHFTFANVVDQVAGTQFGITVTARDQYEIGRASCRGGGESSGRGNVFRRGNEDWGG